MTLSQTPNDFVCIIVHALMLHLLPAYEFYQPYFLGPCVSLSQSGAVLWINFISEAHCFYSFSYMYMALSFDFFSFLNIFFFFCLQAGTFKLQSFIFQRLIQRPPEGYKHCCILSSRLHTHSLVSLNSRSSLFALFVQHLAESNRPGL